jgi:hypothetical protein
MARINTLLATVDQWIIDTLQAAYFWLLDRTGMYLASLQLVILAYVNVVLFRDWSSWNGVIIFLMMFFGVINLLVLGHRYWLQGAGNSKAINSIASFMKGILWRHTINGFLFGGLIGEICTLDILQATSTVSVLVYGYLFLLTIRDREKKPFFERKEHGHLATDPT